ncbi:MAG: NAD(+) synthase [bacterium]|nr:NAD(+) synthase [bacterium]
MKNREEFLDIRKHGFVRVAAANISTIIANPHKNVASIVETLRVLQQAGVQYAVFPELCVTGYTGGDLFNDATLRQAYEEALRMLLDAPSGILFTVGTPVLVDSNHYNAALTILNGQILSAVPKTYLPNYREFYEDRHFCRSTDFNAQNKYYYGNQPSQGMDSGVVEICGGQVLFGTDIILQSKVYPNLKLFTDICEDLWVPVPPSRVAALHGALILSNCSASNVTIGKEEYSELLVRAQSGSCLAAQIYTSAVCESTSDMSWHGCCFIAERGEILAKSELFQRQGTHIIADINLNTLLADRLQQHSSFAANARDYQQKFRIRVFDGELGGNNQNVFFSFARPIEKHPFVPNNPEKLGQRCRQTFMIQADALAQRLESLPADMRKAVIGISGGVDSTQALLVTTKAFDILELPYSDIIAVTMPGFGTVGRTKGNALALMQAVGVTYLEINIKEICELFMQTLGYQGNRKDTPFENIQAWTRTDLLFMIAAIRGGIVIGTGDLSEIAKGWCTFRADHMSHYNPNAGVPKTLISFLIEWVANNLYGDNQALKSILIDIAHTPISPELLVSDGVEMSQLTEDIIGPYELTDFYNYHFVRFGARVDTILRLALTAFEGDYDYATLKRWLYDYLHRFFRKQYKANCVPDGPKVGLVSLSPRGDWRMPADASVQVWIQALDNTPDSLKSY